MRKFAPERVELVVDDLAVVRDPRLVQAILFTLTVAVGDLSAVAGVGQKEQISRRELFGGFADRRFHSVSRRLLSQQQLGFEAAAFGDRLHVVGVEFARDQRAVPSVVMGRIDSIDPNVQRQAARHCVPPRTTNPVLKVGPLPAAVKSGSSWNPAPSAARAWCCCDPPRVRSSDGQLTAATAA